MKSLARRLATIRPSELEQARELGGNAIDVGNVLVLAGAADDGVDDAEVVSKNEYALFVKIDDIELEAFLHCNDLTFLNNGEEKG